MLLLLVVVVVVVAVVCFVMCTENITSGQMRICDAILGLHEGVSAKRREIYWMDILLYDRNEKNLTASSVYW